MPDIPLLEVAGFPCCPADACDDVKEKCTYISTLPGGQGCVRDIIEKTMKLQDKWYNTDTFNFWQAIDKIGLVLMQRLYIYNVYRI